MSKYENNTIRCFNDPKKKGSTPAEKESAIRASWAVLFSFNWEWCFTIEKGMLPERFVVLWGKIGLMASSLSWHGKVVENVSKTILNDKLSSKNHAVNCEHYCSSAKTSVIEGRNEEEELDSNGMIHNWMVAIGLSTFEIANPIRVRDSPASPNRSESSGRSQVRIWTVQWFVQTFLSNSNPRFCPTNHVFNSNLSLTSSDSTQKTLKMFSKGCDWSKSGCSRQYLTRFCLTEIWLRHNFRSRD